jgi:hypothetical protein
MEMTIFMLQGRSPNLLRSHAPYAKILLRATRQLMLLPDFFYDGPAYRFALCGSCV